MIIYMNDKSRGKLRRARIGTLQKKVLKILWRNTLQFDIHRKSYLGMSYKEIREEVYQHIVIGEKLWLQSVYAHLMAEKGDFREANLQLMSGINLLTVHIRSELRDNPPMDRRLGIDERLILIENQKEVEKIRDMVFLYSNTTEKITQESLYPLFLELARDLAPLTAILEGVYDPVDDFSSLTEVERLAAEKAIAIQQASLSRALRILEEHALIEKEDWQIDEAGSLETLYSATDAGIQRLEIGIRS